MGRWVSVSRWVVGRVDGWAGLLKGGWVGVPPFTDIRTRYRESRSFERKKRDVPLHEVLLKGDHDSSPKVLKWDTTVGFLFREMYGFEETAQCFFPILVRVGYKLLPYRVGSLCL